MNVVLAYEGSDIYIEPPLLYYHSMDSELNKHFPHIKLGFKSVILDNQLFV